MTSSVVEPSIDPSSTLKDEESLPLPSKDDSTTDNPHGDNTISKTILESSDTIVTNIGTNDDDDLLSLSQSSTKGPNNQNQPKFWNRFRRSGNNNSNPATSAVNSSNSDNDDGNIITDDNTPNSDNDGNAITDDSTPTFMAQDITDNDDNDGENTINNPNSNVQTEELLLQQTSSKDDIANNIINTPNPNVQTEELLQQQTSSKDDMANNDNDIICEKTTGENEPPHVNIATIPNNENDDNTTTSRHSTTSTKGSHSRQQKRPSRIWNRLRRSNNSTAANDDEVEHDDAVANNDNIFNSTPHDDIEPSKDTIDDLNEDHGVSPTTAVIPNIRQNDDDDGLSMSQTSTKNSQQDKRFWNKFRRSTNSATATEERKSQQQQQDEDGTAKELMDGEGDDDGCDEVPRRISISNLADDSNDPSTEVMASDDVHADNNDDERQNESSIIPHSTIKDNESSLPTKNDTMEPDGNARSNIIEPVSSNRTKLLPDIGTNDDDDLLSLSQTSTKGSSQQNQQPRFWNKFRRSNNATNVASVTTVNDNQEDDNILNSIPPVTDDVVVPSEDTIGGDVTIDNSIAADHEVAMTTTTAAMVPDLGTNDDDDLLSLSQTSTKGSQPEKRFWNRFRRSAGSAEQRGLKNLEEEGDAEVPRRISISNIAVEDSNVPVTAIMASDDVDDKNDDKSQNGSSIVPQSTSKDEESLPLPNDVTTKGDNPVQETIIAAPTSHTKNIPDIGTNDDDDLLSLSQSSTKGGSTTNTHHDQPKFWNRFRRSNASQNTTTTETNKTEHDVTTIPSHVTDDSPRKPTEAKGETTIPPSSDIETNDDDDDDDLTSHSQSSTKGSGSHSAEEPKFWNRFRRRKETIEDGGQRDDDENDNLEDDVIMATSTNDTPSRIDDSQIENNINNDKDDELLNDKSHEGHTNSSNINHEEGTTTAVVGGLSSEPSSRVTPKQPSPRQKQPSKRGLLKRLSRGLSGGVVGRTNDVQLPREDNVPDDVVDASRDMTSEEHQQTTGETMGSIHDDVVDAVLIDDQSGNDIPNDNNNLIDTKKEHSVTMDEPTMTVTGSTAIDNTLPAETDDKNDCCNAAAPMSGKQLPDAGDDTTMIENSDVIRLNITVEKPDVKEEESINKAPTPTHDLNEKMETIPTNVTSVNHAVTNETNITSPPIQSMENDVINNEEISHYDVIDDTHVTIRQRFKVSNDEDVSIDDEEITNATPSENVDDAISAKEHSPLEELTTDAKDDNAIAEPVMTTDDESKHLEMNNDKVNGVDGDNEPQLVESHKLSDSNDSPVVIDDISPDDSNADNDAIDDICSDDGDVGDEVLQEKIVEPIFIKEEESALDDVNADNNVQHSDEQFDVENDDVENGDKTLMDKELSAAKNEEVKKGQVTSCEDTDVMSPIETTQDAETIEQTKPVEDNNDSEPSPTDSNDFIINDETSAHDQNDDDKKIDENDNSTLHNDNTSEIKADKESATIPETTHDVEEIVKEEELITHDTNESMETTAPDESTRIDQKEGNRVTNVDNNIIPTITTADDTNNISRNGDISCDHDDIIDKLAVDENDKSMVPLLCQDPLSVRDDDTHHQEDEGAVTMDEANSNSDKDNDDLKEEAVLTTMMDVAGILDDGNDTEKKTSFAAESVVKKGDSTLPIGLTQDDMKDDVVADANDAVEQQLPTLTEIADPIMIETKNMNESLPTDSIVEMKAENDIQVLHQYDSHANDVMVSSVDVQSETTATTTSNDKSDDPTPTMAHTANISNTSNQPIVTDDDYHCMEKDTPPSLERDVTESNDKRNDDKLITTNSPAPCFNNDCNSIRNVNRPSSPAVIKDNVNNDSMIQGDNMMSLSSSSDIKPDDVQEDTSTMIPALDYVKSSSSDLKEQVLSNDRVMSCADHDSEMASHPTLAEVKQCVNSLPQPTAITSGINETNNAMMDDDPFTNVNTAKTIDEKKESSGSNNDDDVSLSQTSTRSEQSKTEMFWNRITQRMTEEAAPRPSQSEDNDLILRRRSNSTTNDDNNTTTSTTTTKHKRSSSMGGALRGFLSRNVSKTFGTEKEEVKKTTTISDNNGNVVSKGTDRNQGQQQTSGSVVDDLLDDFTPAGEDEMNKSKEMFPDFISPIIIATRDCNDEEEAGSSSSDDDHQKFDDDDSTSSCSDDTSPQLSSKVLFPSLQQQNNTVTPPRDNTPLAFWRRRGTGRAKRHSASPQQMADEQQPQQQRPLRQGIMSMLTMLREDSLRFEKMNSSQSPILTPTQSNETTMTTTNTPEISDIVTKLTLRDDDKDHDTDSTKEEEDCVPSLDDDQDTASHTETNERLSLSSSSSSDNDTRERSGIIESSAVSQSKDVSIDVPKRTFNLNIGETSDKMTTMLSSTVANDTNIDQPKDDYHQAVNDKMLSIEDDMKPSLHSLSMNDDDDICADQQLLATPTTTDPLSPITKQEDLEDKMKGSVVSMAEKETSEVGTTTSHVDESSKATTQNYDTDVVIKDESLVTNTSSNDNEQSSSTIVSSSSAVSPAHCTLGVEDDYDDDRPLKKDNEPLIENEIKMTDIDGPSSNEDINNTQIPLDVTDYKIDHANEDHHQPCCDTTDSLSISKEEQRPVEQQKKTITADENTSNSLDDSMTLVASKIIDTLSHLESKTDNNDICQQSEVVATTTTTAKRENDDDKVSNVAVTRQIDIINPDETTTEMPTAIVREQYPLSYGSDDDDDSSSEVNDKYAIPTSDFNESLTFNSDRDENTMTGENVSMSTLKGDGRRSGQSRDMTEPTVVVTTITSPSTPDNPLENDMTIMEHIGDCAAITNDTILEKEIIEASENKHVAVTAHEDMCLIATTEREKINRNETLNRAVMPAGGIAAAAAAAAMKKNRALSTSIEMPEGGIAAAAAAAAVKKKKSISLSESDDRPAGGIAAAAAAAAAAMKSKNKALSTSAEMPAGGIAAAAAAAAAKKRENKELSTSAEMPAGGIAAAAAAAKKNKALPSSAKMPTGGIAAAAAAAAEMKKKVSPSKADVKEADTVVEKKHKVSFSGIENPAKGKTSTAAIKAKKSRASCSTIVLPAGGLAAAAAAAAAKKKGRSSCATVEMPPGGIAALAAAAATKKKKKKKPPSSSVEDKNLESEKEKHTAPENTNTPTSENKESQSIFIPCIDIPLKEDPDYVKYFKMLKMGLPMGAVKNALVRDGKDPSIMDLDPEKSLKSQMKSDESRDDIPLKDDPDYVKYFKMLKMGLPMGAVKNALVRDGKDPSIMDLDPEKSLKSQTGNDVDEGPPLKEDPDYMKYFKMLKMGLPMGAVKNALVRDGKDPSIMDLDPDKSLKSQTNDAADEGPPLKDDPEYAKYFKMLKMGLPMGAVKNALVRDGKDPSIMDLDPEKSLKSQTENDADEGPPLKEDPDFVKYFKMLKMGLPVGAVKNALVRDGKDPSIMDLDPEKSLKYQQKQKKQKPKKPKVDDKPKVKRKRLFWNSMTQVSRSSIWAELQSTSRSDIRMDNLKFDQDEFEKLFVATICPKNEKQNKTDESKKQKNKKVQIIDGKRVMNGGIILAKIKVDYASLAAQFYQMDPGDFDVTQLSALQQFLASDEESHALDKYINSLDSSEREVCTKSLSECEKYMLEMMKVKNINDKFDCMLYQIQFESRYREFHDELTSLEKACDDVRTSPKLKKLLAMVLMLGNYINNGKSSSDVAGFRLESLLKLNEAKAFDKKTSVLHYLVKLVKQNDDSLLNFKKDIISVEKAERITLEATAEQLKRLSKELEEVKKTVLQDKNPKNRDHIPHRTYNLKDYDQDQLDTLPSSRIDKFIFVASKKIQSGFNTLEVVQMKYTETLKYFGEDTNVPSHEFFGTLQGFILVFDMAVKHIVKEEENAKRAAKLEATRKAKEEEKRRRLEARQMALEKMSASRNLGTHVLHKSHGSKNVIHADDFHFDLKSRRRSGLSLSSFGGVGGTRGARCSPNEVVITEESPNQKSNDSKDVNTSVVVACILAGNEILKQNEDVEVMLKEKCEKEDK